MVDSEMSTDKKRALFMISIAADLAEMHPQTLRMYERKGLISPKRSSKRTRLYSMEDVEKLRYIQQLTSRDGLNLAGVEHVLRLEERLSELREKVGALKQELDRLSEEAEEEMEAVHRSYRREMIPVPKPGVAVYQPARRWRGREWWRTELPLQPRHRLATRTLGARRM